MEHFKEPSDKVSSSTKLKGELEESQDGFSEAPQQLQKVEPVIRVVIARYKELLDWLFLIPDGYEIYVSNSGDDEPQIPEKVKNRTRIVKVQNGGREVGHWLRYITSNYDDLADIHIFLQGSPHIGHSNDILFGQWLERPYVESRVAQAKGFSYIYDQSTKRVASGGTDPAMAICHAHGRRYLPLPPPLSGGDWGGQHIVTKEAIQNRPVEFYEGLIEYGCSPKEVPFEHSGAKELRHRFGWLWERASNVLYDVWPD